MKIRRYLLLFFTLCALPAISSPAEEFRFPLKPNSARFAVVGDTGTGDSAQYAIAQRMVEAHQQFPFEFVLMVGDNIYGGASPSNYEKKFSAPYKPLLDIGIKFYASLGNHDNPNERFYNLFNMNGQQYYTFKKSNARFFALDSNYMKPEQLSWLEKELQSADSNWKIAFFHHPLYSSARTHGPATDLRLRLEPLFIKYGLQVTLTGHEHVYERILPQNGIYHFIEGASGQLRPGDLQKSSITASGFDADRTFMLFEIVGDDLYFQTITRIGQTVDSGVIHRPGAPK